MNLKYTVELNDVENNYPELYAQYIQFNNLAKECGLTEQSTLENSIMFGLVKHMQGNLRWMKNNLENRIKEKNEGDDKLNSSIDLTEENTLSR